MRVGFLPLYLKLYDEVLPGMRKRVDGFSAVIQKALIRHRLDLAAAPVCRTSEEFEAAAALFADSCAVITLHLAYSPSLESIDMLAGLGKPVIVLDTTPVCSFDSSVDATEILHNHGIHGVQDMCSMLKRRGVRYFVVSGHWEAPAVIDRVARLCRAADAARVMETGRIGLIGTPFKGMGDFHITPDELAKTVGAEVIPFDFAEIPKLTACITDAQVESEMASDLSAFDCAKYDQEAHRRTARMGLVVRKWVEKNGLSAYSMNFADVERKRGFQTVPFIEASKSMGRGIGYAGEGDVLTAALCGALLRLSPETSFTEMFCPDWKGSSIFLSHMGELNPRTAKGRMRLTAKEYAFSDVDAPIMLYGGFKPGNAVLVNLAQTAPGRFTLILSRAKVLDVEAGESLRESIHGWIRPDRPVADFLEKYSMAGGTHHLVLVYGDYMEALHAFGQMMQFEVEIL
jgi:L-arabinose isomerase